MPEDPVSPLLPNHHQLGGKELCLSVHWTSDMPKMVKGHKDVLRSRFHHELWNEAATDVLVFRSPACSWGKGGSGGGCGGSVQETVAVSERHHQPPRFTSACSTLSRARMFSAIHLCACLCVDYPSACVLVRMRGCVIHTAENSGKRCFRNSLHNSWCHGRRLLLWRHVCLCLKRLK